MTVFYNDTLVPILVQLFDEHGHIAYHNFHNRAVLCRWWLDSRDRRLEDRMSLEGSWRYYVFGDFLYGDAKPDQTTLDNEDLCEFLVEKIPLVDAVSSVECAEVFMQASDIHRGKSPELASKVSAFHEQQLSKEACIATYFSRLEHEYLENVLAKASAVQKEAATSDAHNEADLKKTFVFAHGK